MNTFTRVCDAVVLFIGILGVFLMIAAPPFGWGIVLFVILAIAFGGDA